MRIAGQWCGHCVTALLGEPDTRGVALMSESSLITSYKHDTQQQFADSVSSQLGDHPNDCRSPCLEGDGGGIDCFLSARVGRAQFWWSALSGVAQVPLYPCIGEPWKP